MWSNMAGASPATTIYHLRQHAKPVYSSGGACPRHVTLLPPYRFALITLLCTPGVLYQQGLRLTLYNLGKEPGMKPS